MKNKNTRLISTVSLLFLGFSMNAIALDIGENDIITSMDAAVMSTYVWRGIVLTDDPVLQPALTAGYKGMSCNIWGNMDLGDVNDTRNEFNEIDYTLDYSFDVHTVSISAGILHYSFPHTDFDPTTELYLGLSSGYTKDASLTIYQDIGESDGTYFLLGYDYGIPVAEITSIDIGGTVGFGTSKNNEFYYGNNTMSLTDVVIGVSAPFKIGAYVSLTPGITFTSIISSDIRTLVDESGANPDNFIYGITISAGF